jgi:uncharacterized protein YndB with AHSA1/START domain
MSPEKSSPESTSDREIILTRVLNAPRELVWQAWADPKHIVNWWGPRGFTTTIKRMEFRVGGIWEHTMHGPDGKNYPNKSIFKEIVPLERITYSHGGGREDAATQGANFVATWTFETVDGNQTRLTGRMVFHSKEARDRVVREYGAIEGGKQTLERAAEYVTSMGSGTSARKGSSKLRVHCYSISLDGGPALKSPTWGGGRRAPSLVAGHPDLCTNVRP